MDLIRNDAQVALNEIVAASRRLAARLRHASEIIDSDVFSDPADEVDRLAEELAERQRAEDEDEIPSAPSDEALLVDAAAMRVRLAIVDNLADVRDEWYRTSPWCWTSTQATCRMMPGPGGRDAEGDRENEPVEAASCHWWRSCGIGGRPAGGTGRSACRAARDAAGADDRRPSDRGSGGTRLFQLLPAPTMPNRMPSACCMPRCGGRNP